MRRGLDFAWSRPGVDAILAGGFTFVLRYLSYDTTGKNLTRKEADTYRSHGIDVVSNWEYADNAALNGRSQGVRDATEGQRQHLACGGDPAAPIYFSVDINATEAQQPAIDAYLAGCASVIGPARVGVYGGYWVVKRCLDNRSAAWGWQTLAWSGGLWDPRAALRQVLNGVQVGGADCDIDETDRANFGQWYAPAGDPAERPVWTGDDDDMYLIRQRDSGAVYCYNGQYRTYLESPERLAAHVALGLAPVDVDDVTQYGIEFSPAEYYADRDAQRAHVASPGGGSGPVTLSPEGVQQVEDAAFRAAQHAEDA